MPTLSSPPAAAATWAVANGTTINPSPAVARPMAIAFGRRAILALSYGTIPRSLLLFPSFYFGFSWSALEKNCHTGSFLIPPHFGRQDQATFIPLMVGELRRPPRVAELGTRWQAAAWLGSFSSRAGTTSRQMSVASGQRSRKAHPSRYGSLLSPLVSRPVRVVRRRGCWTGTASRRACV